MKNTDKTPATFESVWALIQEMSLSHDKRMKDHENIMKEHDERMKEHDERFDKEIVEYNKRIKESEERYERRMKNIEDRYGSMAQNLGCFVEEYFFNSFEKGEKNFFGEKFDDIEKQMKGYTKNYKDEYDIVMLNGTSVAIVETKFKGHENDLPKIFSKAETFRINFPYFKKHKIYLGLGSMSFYPELENECIKNGIAVVKQVGDSVVINYDHLKVF